MDQLSSIQLEALELLQSGKLSYYLTKPNSLSGEDNKECGEMYRLEKLGFVRRVRRVLDAEYHSPYDRYVLVEKAIV